MTTGIKFNEATHRYWLDGKPCPGVTTLIKGGLPAPALMYWSARTVAEWVADNEAEVEQLRGMGRSPMVAALKEVPWQKRDRAAAKGTEVHALAEALVNGAEVTVPAHLEGYVDGCLAFLTDWGAEELVVEKSVAHRGHGWCGRLDLIARLRDGKTWLLDYKSAASGIWPETAFQLSAYSHAEFWQDDDGEHPLPQIDACGAVHLPGDGSYSLVPVDGGDSTYQTFRHIATVARKAKDAKALVGRALELDSIPTLEGIDA